MAAFDRHYAGPGTERLAAQMVIAVHFDYQNLTMLERKFKKYAPFFVWTRRNLPLQLQMLLERPSMINLWNHVQRAGEQGEDSFAGFPLSQYASPLTVKLDSARNEDSPFWARLIWDPDMPVQILDDIPLFARQDPSGLVPVKHGSPLEWLKWSSQLFGPQFTIPMNILKSEEFGDVEAPRGLNELLQGIDAMVEFSGQHDLLRTSGGDAMIPRWARSTIESLVPFYNEYRQYLGFLPADPNRLAREGYTDENSDLLSSLVRGNVDEATERLVTGPGMGVFRGLGLGYQTPNDTRGAAFEASEIIADVRRRLASQG